MGTGETVETSWHGSARGPGDQAILPDLAIQTCKRCFDSPQCMGREHARRSQPRRILGNATGKFWPADAIGPANSNSRPGNADHPCIKKARPSEPSMKKPRPASDEADIRCGKPGPFWPRQEPRSSSETCGQGRHVSMFSKTVRSEPEHLSIPLHFACDRAQPGAPPPSNSNRPATGRGG
ncbi:hypothetical protein V7x_08540 [Crateriforma conspicua]|uniref:Uncharacterized protein n=1 Tax=Crateriforma conspicua TaxID=2527996 RepID=A0A5C6FVB0_9PLAN|nr:hypothetical protein V7x_08540 [Crateriforma conspicua]